MTNTDQANQLEMETGEIEAEAEEMTEMKDIEVADEEITVATEEEAEEVIKVTIVAAVVVVDIHKEYRYPIISQEPEMTFYQTISNLR